MFRPQQGKIPDKIAILEIVEEDELFYLYIHCGNCSRKRLRRSLKQKTEYLDLALTDFEKLVNKKIKEKYVLVPNGGQVRCEGANAVLFPAQKNKPKKSTTQTHKNQPEHRKLLP